MKPLSLANVPVVINSRDRLEPLERLVSWLERRGAGNIIFLDNASTYPPLLEYFDRSPHTVVRLRSNVGYLALWESGIFERICPEHFVYSDPDVVPLDECPDDWLDLFAHTLSHHDIAKVGFSLKIDDLPTHYFARERVIAHEEQFWARPVGTQFFDAAIDTTFALYRPGARGGWWLPALRTAPPYAARHLPWYSDSENPTAEDLYYHRNASTPAYWTRAFADEMGEAGA